MQWQETLSSIAMKNWLFCEDAIYIYIYIYTYTCMNNLYACMFLGIYLFAFVKYSKFVRTWQILGLLNLS